MRKSHGQRSLAGYSPQGCKESDTTEATEHAGRSADRLGSRATKRDYTQYCVQKNKFLKIVFWNLEGLYHKKTKRSRAHTVKSLQASSDLNFGLLCSGDYILRTGGAERIKCNPSFKENALVEKSEHSRKKLVNNTPQTTCAVRMVGALSLWPSIFWPLKWKCAARLSQRIVSGKRRSIC